MSLTIPAGASRTYTAAALEAGDDAGLTGSLGNGTGKWRLGVESTREIVAMSLLSSPTGHLTNLSTAPDNETDGAHRIPLFPAASDPTGRQGFARVINRSDTAGSVTIQAFDDTDRVYETLLLAVGANETKHFNSDDLELGNDGKGLSGSTGAGEGDWRLELTSDLEIDVLSYVRTADGFLTAMHDTVPPEGTRHRVAVFNPGSNASQASRLRLVNAGEDVAEVTVAGIDDAGKTSDTVSLSVPPDTPRSLTAQELESGGDGFDGKLGDGAGKWRLDVASTQPITVMSLLSSPTGHLTNLSTAPASHFAPTDGAMFRDRFVGGWVVERDPESRVEFLAGDRFRMTAGSGSREGAYTYTRTGRHDANVVLDFDDGNRCTYRLAFASRLAGRHTYTCDDGESGESAWHADGLGNAAGEPPDPFDLDAANGDPIGIAHGDGLLYVPDAVDGKVYVYTTEGERREDTDFVLHEDNDDPTGIAHADGRLYVVDDEDIKVYAYRVTGERDAGSDFELDTGNDRPEGMTYVDGRFHVVDDFGDVFAYRPGGTRDPDADFELDPSNLFPAGITHTGRRFFVVDWLDEKVYAYAATGERAEASDFDLYPEAGFAAGIAHDGVWFYVVDDIRYRVWAYSGGERTQEGPDLSVSVAETAFTLAPEASFELAVSVRNAGDEASPETVLRYYSSSDDSITSGDTELGSEDVDGLESAESRQYAIELTAPAEPGLYHYGACVDPVEGESVDGNNCSGPLGITVSEPGAVPAVRRISLDDDIGFARGIAVADDVLYLPGWRRNDIYAHALTGERIVDMDIPMDPDNDDPERVVHAEGRLHVLDEEDGWVYAYDIDGGRATDLDFRLDPQHIDPDGFAYADGTFYILDELFSPEFGPHPIGSTDRHYRLLVPGRCRHTVGGSGLDADCTYERTAPDAGRIFLEFDDSSKGSCEVTLAYSSLTAGTFVDECFDAGVDTNVPFDRSLRMPELRDGGVDAEVPRAPRTQEEFDVFAWGRADLIPGLGFGCPPVFETCHFGSGSAYTIGRDAETGLPLYVLGDYSYENTGPSSGRLVFDSDTGEGFEIILEFEPAGSIRATIDDIDGTASEWPGMPHLDLTLGAQSVLLPIPPSWSAAIAIEADFSDVDEFRVRKELLRRFFPDLGKVIGGGSGLQYRSDYVRVGRNRAVQTFGFSRRDPRFFDGLDATERARKLALNGTEWSFVLTFTSDGGAEFSLRAVKEGQFPTMLEGFVDFVGDGIVLDEFPDELQLPDEAPQASGEDFAGVEVAAAASVDEIASHDLQTLLVSASGAEFEPGDWLEPKDGGNQRMMIVAAGETSVSSSASRTDLAWVHPGAAVTKRVDIATDSWREFKLPPSLRPPVIHAPRAASDSHLVQLWVVCMQLRREIPTRGARFFSKAKVAEGSVQSCQKDCVLDGGNNIQGCVWACE